MSGPVKQRTFHLEGLGRETGWKVEAGAEVKVQFSEGSEMLGFCDQGNLDSVKVIFLF